MVAPDRRDAIRTLLLEGGVQSQAELIERLAARGIRTTQPVVCRELRQLRAVKRDGEYRLLAEERVTPLESLRSLLRGARPAGTNLLVVQCEPGAASAIARALEAEQLPDIVGTVAGDDTVFVAVGSREAGARVRRLVVSLL